VAGKEDAEHRVAMRVAAGTIESEHDADGVRPEVARREPDDHGTGYATNRPSGFFPEPSDDHRRLRLR